MNRADPTGLVCTTVSSEDQCTFDVFKDRNGKIISRQDALSSGGKIAKALGMDRASRILRAESKMTAKYTAAKNLAAKGGSVTIKGDTKEGIPDQNVAGSDIVQKMESVETIATAQTSSKGINADASTPGNKLGNPSSGPITYWRDGAASQDLGRTFGHEILHTLYSGVGLENRGWTNPDFNLQHQGPFSEAADEIQ